MRYYRLTQSEFIMSTAQDAIRSLSGLPRRLALDGILAPELAAEAMQKSRASKTPFITYVVENELASETDVATTASREFGLPLLDLNAFDIDRVPIEHADEETVEKFRAFPLIERDARLYIAISDPTNLAPLDHFKFKSGLSTEAVLVEDGKLASFISRLIDRRSANFADDLDADLESLQTEDTESKEELNQSDIDDAPVVRFCNKLLLDAIRRGASDIHVEPYEKVFRVRYRIDGMLEEVTSPPLSMSSRIIARMKVMSRMDISERRLPQDGRIKLRISRNKAIDFRVNTCPTLFGEKVVLRILDSSAATLGIDSLGYEPVQKKAYMDALGNPYGMILVTGPTGSGKTVSLYTGLNILNTEDRNISTAEDPVEINLQGINQVNVNNKVGLTFSEALKSFLRQDPDIIMVGEIRDLETAGIAIKAAQTGHMVMSTLHTNDAPQTLTRLVNMGIAPFAVASAVSLIIAQRLGRRLCDSCKAPDKIPAEALLKEGFLEEEIPSLQLFKPVGCDKCNKGYKGRTGIYQVMPISENIGRIIMEGGNALQIADQAKVEGIIDLRGAALLKVRAGILGLEEANRISKD